jgi:hypothetical protein
VNGPGGIRVLAAAVTVAVTGADIVSTIAACGGGPATRFANALPRASRAVPPGKGGSTGQPPAAARRPPPLSGCYRVR